MISRTVLLLLLVYAIAHNRSLAFHCGRQSFVRQLPVQTQAQSSYSPSPQTTTGSTICWTSRSSPFQLQPDNRNKLQAMATYTEHDLTSFDTNIALEQSFPDRQLDEGVTIRAATRAFVVDGSEYNDREELCSGYLIERRHTARSDEKEIIVCEVALTDSNDVGKDHDLQIKAAQEVLDSLFLHYLILEQQNEGTFDWAFEIHTEREKPGTQTISYQAAIDRGFRPLKNNNDPKNDFEILTFDYNLGLREYMEHAFQYRRVASGGTALEIIGLLSARRHVYNFDTQNTEKNSCLIAPQKQLVPPGISSQVLSAFENVVQNGWLATTPDSVDGEPTLHLILVAKGHAKFPEKHKEVTGEEQKYEDSDLTESGRKIFSLMQPIIYDELLPKVRKLTNSTTVEVCDVFMRRYAEDVTIASGAGDGGTIKQSRKSIAGHYDFDMFATSVVAFDNVAADGKNGMYTSLLPSAPCVDLDGVSKTGCGTSNHMALRRYFPLSTGDAVVHTWDVLHGVEIESGMSRTSLVVWFSDGPPIPASNDYLPPWLEDPGEGDIGLFLSAGAKSRRQHTRVRTPEANNTRNGENSIEDSNPATAIVEDTIQSEKDGELNPHEMYVRSASVGNAFALMTLGIMCMQEALAPPLLKRVVTMLEAMRSTANIDNGSHTDDNTNEHTTKDALRPNFLSSTEFDIDLSGSTTDLINQQSGSIARRLWLEAAMRGEAKAQVALGEVLMDSAFSSLFADEDKTNDGHHDNVDDMPLVSSSEDLLAMAAVMYSFAVQQEHPGAIESLAYLVDVTYSSLYADEERKDDFSNSPVHMIAQAADIRFR